VNSLLNNRPVNRNKKRSPKRSRVKNVKANLPKPVNKKPALLKSTIEAWGDKVVVKNYSDVKSVTIKKTSIFSSSRMLLTRRVTVSFSHKEDLLANDVGGVDINSLFPIIDRIPQDTLIRVTDYLSAKTIFASVKLVNRNINMSLNCYFVNRRIYDGLLTGEFNDDNVDHLFFSNKLTNRQVNDYYGRQAIKDGICSIS
jgi:hypothetical protein